MTADFGKMFFSPIQKTFFSSSVGRGTFSGGRRRGHSPLSKGLPPNLGCEKSTSIIFAG